MPRNIFTIAGFILLLATQAIAGPWTAWQNALAPTGVPGHKLTLSKNGAAAYVVVIPEKASTQEQKAAEDLVLWLKEMTGTEFPIVRDSTPPRDKEISIGNTNRLVDIPEAKQDLQDEGYAIAVKDKRLFLLGGRVRGPINAVYALLEEDLGCRWYAGSSATIPKRSTLKFRPAPRVFTPILMLRDPFYQVAFDGTWSLRNRTNAPSAAIPEEWGGNVNYVLFVHTFNTLLPPDQYFKDHPEYFMLGADGKRSAQQLCTTNPDVIRIVTENTLRFLKDNPNAEIISVSKNDGGGTCLCPNCKALDDAEGTNAAALLFLVNKVAEAVEKEYPRVIVDTLAYLETVKPPKALRPRKNVAIRLCTDNCMWSKPFTPAEEVPAFHDAMVGWSAIHDRITIWDYCVNFSHYPAPMPNLPAIAANIRFFVAHNAKGVMEQGAYQSPCAENDLLRAWVFAKLMWDPTRDLDALVQDFIWGYFGNAAPAIAEYNALLAKTAQEHTESMKSPKDGIRYPMDSEFLTKEFLLAASALYDKAEQLADSDELKQHVERDRIPILYVLLCRGPEFVGADYGAVLDRFETIAHREKMTHIYEGPPDLDQKLQGWRDAWNKTQTKEK
ncbi:MAG TPA: DUF4838 domain-containing protein [Candidatus Hydrogenedentes bacterium]|nr:DUF4838 domain-containing protein [Candidatus Hydrogenedentota bacterium]